MIKHLTNSPLLHIYETALLPLACQTEKQKVHYKVSSGPCGLPRKIQL